MPYTEFYCDYTNGLNTNAGDNSANGLVTSTNGGWSTTTNVFTAASGTPFSGVSVGDFASVYTDGSTVTGYITRVTAVGGGGATLTLSTTAKAGTAPTTATTGITCKTGGVWKGPNAASGFPFSLATIGSLTNASGNAPRFNLKNNATYAVTANITSASVGPYVVQGYATSVGDGGRATIDGGTSGTAYIVVTASGNRQRWVDIIVANNGASSVSPIFRLSGTGSCAERCVARNSRGDGFNLIGTYTQLKSCEAYANCANNSSGGGGITTNGATSFALIDCISHDNTGTNTTGFVLLDAGTVIGCIADTNGKAGFDLSSTNSCRMKNCVAYNNVTDGIILSNALASMFDIENCILMSNGTAGSVYGINGTGAGSRIGGITNCAFYNNRTGQTNGLSAMEVVGSVTLTGDPFNAASTGNFTLNNTAGAGAACRGAGRGTFTQTQASYTGSVSYPDIGATQHMETSSGGGAFTFVG